MSETCREIANVRRAFRWLSILKLASSGNDPENDRPEVNDGFILRVMSLVAWR